MPGVNFTNIIRTAFLYESFARSFFVPRFKVCTFLAQKNIGTKAARNMLVKLTPDHPKSIGAKAPHKILTQMTAKRNVNVIRKLIFKSVIFRMSHL